MNTLTAPEKHRPIRQLPRVAEIDRAYVRLAAVVVEAPEEILLAIHLAGLPIQGKLIHSFSS